MMTWQLQDVELNMGICSMLEQGRDVHSFFRKDKTKLLPTNLKASFGSNQYDAVQCAVYCNRKREKGKSYQLTGFPSMPGGPRSPKSPGKP